MPEKFAQIATACSSKTNMNYRSCVCLWEEGSLYSSTGSPPSPASPSVTVVNGHLFVLLVGSPFGLLRPLHGYGICYKGVTLVLGELDVAQVKPCPSGQGQPPVHSAWFQPRRQTAVTHYWGHRPQPGGRLPPGPEYVSHGGMRHDVWRDKKRNWCYKRPPALCTSTLKLWYFSVWLLIPGDP